RVEFKKAKNKLPSNLFETICAFLNKSGGEIILGVDDNKNYACPYVSLNFVPLQNI
ncbi:MAG: ATP-binding protein, partial [Bacteroidales bacterium]|nr:ATP-binding protein [Bacteroidales bacterium]